MSQDFLFELLTEELPPKALTTLRDALLAEVVAGLERIQLGYEKIQGFASPRRLAFIVTALASSQQAMKVERKGPAVAAALDQSGEPTKAALGFAQSCGVTFEQLTTFENEKGAWLYYEYLKPGESAEKLLPEIIEQALKRLPIPKLMTWGEGQYHFVRPVHGVLALLGDKVLPLSLFGFKAGAKTVGHRFHHPEAIKITHATTYVDELRQAYVIVDFDERRDEIASHLTGLAEREGASLVANDSLLAEVTALVEWPVALLGNFAEKFLEVPEEVLILSMASHQRYFALRDADNKLLSKFILVSNIISKSPENVVKGNEKVLHARFSDADFFYAQDKKIPLSDYTQRLSGVVFQKQLGSLYDKVMRIQNLAQEIARHLAADEAHVARVAELCKCDLMTDMVGEFPELQGVMGRYYALSSGEQPNVALAIEAHYEPRFAGDLIHDNVLAHCVAIADRIDTLVGIIGINKQPTGDKDPFALRRQALGVLRILIEKGYQLDLDALINQSIDLYGERMSNEQTALQVRAFIDERFKQFCLQQGYAIDAFYAVQNTHLTSPVSFVEHLRALSTFSAHPDFDALVVANKRVANILKKSSPATSVIHENFLQEASERSLFDLLTEIKPAYDEHLRARRISDALALLAQLKPAIDAFFNDVMVMVDNQALRDNRLSLLLQLRTLFLQIADFSALHPVNSA